LHLFGILFPHINDDARSKSHQIRDYFLDPGAHKEIVFEGTSKLTNMWTRIVPIWIWSSGVFWWRQQETSEFQQKWRLPLPCDFDVSIHSFIQSF